MRCDSGSSRDRDQSAAHNNGSMADGRKKPSAFLSASVVSVRRQGGYRELLASTESPPLRGGLRPPEPGRPVVLSQPLECGGQAFPSGV